MVCGGGLNAFRPVGSYYQASTPTDKTDARLFLSKGFFGKC